MDKLNSEDAIEYIALNTQTMRLAASLWAKSRNKGKPTADNKSLDGDIILIAQIREYYGLQSKVVVATTNVKHLEDFVDAQLWNNISADYIPN